MPERVLSPKQIEAVLKLDGPGRYDHFIKHVVDCEQAWGLYNDGWAMGSDHEDNPTFPLWPAREYAARCAEADWAEFEPTPIPLAELIDELLPNLRDDGVTPSVFRTPDGQSAMPSVDDLLADLAREMEQYG